MKKKGFVFMVFFFNLKKNLQLIFDSYLT